MDIAATLRHNQLVNIARLYYLHRLTHQQIADRLGLNRIKVTRLLQKALESGIIEFRIADPALSTLELGDRLEKTFGLRRALVTPSPDTDESLLPLLSHYASRLLVDLIDDGAVVGLGWGSTVDAVCECVEKMQSSGVQVVSLTGGLAAGSNYPNPYDVVSRFAARIGAKPHYLLLPAIVESEQARAVLEQEPHYRQIKELWGRLDVCLVSIGRLSADSGILYSFADPQAQCNLLIKQGGVGDILSRPFDRSGKFLETDFARRIITVDFDSLKKARDRIGVAGGIAKVESIRAALRSGLLTTLVTDEHTARAVLE